MPALVTENLSIIATATNTETTEVSHDVLAAINGADFVAHNGLEAWQIYSGRIAGSRATFMGSGVELNRGGLSDSIANVYGDWALELRQGYFITSIGTTLVDSPYTV